MLDVHLQLTIPLQLSIRMLDVHLIEELQLSASRILLPFWWRVLILELASVDAEVFWGRALGGLNFWCGLLRSVQLM
jgi:hypothetical protein